MPIWRCTTKARGSGRSEIYDTNMQDRATRRLALHRDLRAAVDNEAFTLHCQPVVSLTDGDIVGGREALVRWQTGSDTLCYRVTSSPMPRRPG